MTNQISNHAAAARMIRAELKKHGIQASVTSESFSMGNAVRVRIKQDIAPATAAEINAFCSQFQYGSFDGMTDSYSCDNRRDDIPQAKYVDVTVEYSDEIKAAAHAYIDNIIGIDEWDRDSYAWMALNGSWGDFWTARKPRIRLAA